MPPHQAAEARSVSGNELEGLPADMLASLSGLKWLFLSRNLIKALPEDLLAPLTCLELLALNGTELERAPAVGGLSEPESVSSPPRTNWTRLHEEVIVGNALSCVCDDYLLAGCHSRTCLACNAYPLVWGC